MRKVIFALALILSVGFIGTQVQAYHGGLGWGHGVAASPEQQKFLTETGTLRNELYAAQAELNAQLAQPKPNEAKIRELSCSVADKQVALALKAREYNLPAHGAGHGLGHGSGYANCGW
ncbi:hypothetical protein [Desulfocurvibacter africanus]|uniref:hypothetical protein n=1 Tax=Desulfocurvibacter africanus TaxID=873 RepID=UPI0004155316|nr:hypothetical protein [Desulfocurvibacter africanus]